MTRAVVVGSGPNGLAAALTLAAAGADVHVIEAAEVLGGGTRSAELTVPGLVHDECSAIHPLGPPSQFAAEFDLAGAGLQWTWAPVEYAHPLDGGRGGAVVRSVAETAGGMGAGGHGWERLFGPLNDRFDTIVGEIVQPALHVPEHPIHLARFGALSGIPATALAATLRSEEAAATFLGVAAHAFRPLGGVASSAIGLALGTAAHRYGWPAAKGGSEAIASAMIRRAEQHGATFETGFRVTSADELGPVDILMLDTSPSDAARILGTRLSSRVHRAYTRYRHGPGAFKVDFAVDGGIPWAYAPARQASTVHVGGSAAEMVAAEKACAKGRMPERPFILVAQQSVADPSRSVGSVHPVYAYAHVPAGYEGDATETIIARIEQYAPGFRDRIVGMAVRSTTDMARHNPNYVGGDILTGTNSPWRLAFRPRATLHPYDTGVPGVYLCSAATPPGPGAHGMCGYNAARRALQQLTHPVTSQRTPT